MYSGARALYIYMHVWACVCACVYMATIYVQKGDRVTLIRRQPGGPTASTSAAARFVCAPGMYILVYTWSSQYILSTSIIYMCACVVYKYMRACVRVYIIIRLGSAARWGAHWRPERLYNIMHTARDRPTDRLPRRSQINTVGGEERCSRCPGWINIRRVTYCCVAAAAAALSRAHISTAAAHSRATSAVGPPTRVCSRVATAAAVAMRKFGTEIAKKKKNKNQKNPDDRVYTRARPQTFF